MNRFWVAGLILAALVVIFVVHRMMAARRRVAEEVRKAELLRRRAEFDAGTYDPDDTAPAVLSPPEWQDPKAGSSGHRRG